MAIWNNQDPILKERLFGLTHAEGNPSKDVKALYNFLDSTPTHSCPRHLYAALRPRKESWSTGSASERTSSPFFNPTVFLP